MPQKIRRYNGGRIHHEFSDKLDMFVKCLDGQSIANRTQLTSKLISTSNSSRLHAL